MKITIKKDEKPKKKRVYATTYNNVTGESMTYGKKVKQEVPASGQKQVGNTTVTFSKKKAK